MTTTAVFTPGEIWNQNNQSFLKYVEINNLKNTAMLEAASFIVELGNESSKTKAMAIMLELKIFPISTPFQDIPGLEIIADQKVCGWNQPLYAYALPGKRSVEVIKNFVGDLAEDSNFEIYDYGAGLCLWSLLFLNNNLPTRAIECKEVLRKSLAYDGWTFLTDSGLQDRITYVEKTECALPENCAQKMLFLSWPENPKEPESFPIFAGRTLNEFAHRGGRYAVYVGLGKGSVTAADDFFEEMDEAWNVTLCPDRDVVQEIAGDGLAQEGMWLLKKKERSPYRILIALVLGVSYCFFHGSAEKPC